MNNEDFTILDGPATLTHDSLKKDDNPQRKDLKDIFGDPGAVDSLKYYVRMPVSGFSDSDFSSRLHQVSIKAKRDMPLQIQDDLKREDICASFMGILPEINRVWVTIDNVIYFWNYMSDVRDDLLIYEGLSEVVYSVTLVTTKPDTFTDMVAYLLVVVTPVEVCLLAVIRDDNEGPMGREASDFSLQSIQPTKYSTPSDNMTFFCVAGTSSGRIFMAASDNNVYEFQYSNEESSWMHYLGIGSDFSCKKKRHAPARENSFSNLFSIFGGTDDKLVDLVVDEPRKLLYSISKTGNLSLFYLESESAPVPIQTVNIMSKARNIRSKVLKSDDIAVNVFVVSAEESAQIHGVVVLASGVRVFFTVHGYGSDLYFGPQSATSNKKPRGLDIAYIRQPPKETELEKLKVESVILDDHYSHPASTGTAASENRSVYKSFYSHGSFFAASRSVRNQGGSEFMLLHTRMERTFTKPDEGEIKESMCPLYNLQGDNPSRDKKIAFNNQVEDIKEISWNLFNAKASKLQRLSYASRSPADIGGTTSKPRLVRNDVDYLEPVPGPGSASPYLGRPLSTGYTTEDFEVFNKVSTLASQMLPTDSCSQRRFLVLSHDGIRLVVQQRPIDYLYTLIATNDAYIKEKVFDFYGVEESCAMCLAIACNIPRDAGAALGGDFFPRPSGVPDGHVQRVAIEHLRLHSATYSRDNIASDSKMFSAFYLLFSRLVRPIWFRILIQAKEKRDTGGGITYRPILGSEELNCILDPLLRLQDILESSFPDAVAAHGKAVQIGNQITNVISEASTLIAPGGTGVVNGYQARQARIYENEKINHFYRLLLRTIQALNVVSILQRAADDRRIRVPWEALKDMTFAKMVVGNENHRHYIKQVLHDLVCKSIEIGSDDSINQDLEENCFHFYSAGDVHLYLGRKSLKTAEDSPQHSDRRSTHTELAVNELCKAARYWRHMQDVKHVEGSEKACILPETCEKLVYLGERGQEGVVSVCMAAAKNFGGGNEVDFFGQHSTRAPKDDWRLDLYHGGSVTAPNDVKKAKEHCYLVLLDNLDFVRTGRQLLTGAGVVSHDTLQAGEENFRNMLEKSISATNDVDFHHMLYDFLLAKSMNQYLLELETDHIENYLRKKSPDDFYDYLWRHKRYFDATIFMSTEARKTDDEEVKSIPDRIQCFAKAEKSAEAACRYPEARSQRLGRSNAADLLKEIRTARQMAEFQWELVEEATNELLYVKSQLVFSEEILGALNDVIEEASYTLFDYSKMYNKISSPLQLWEFSLKIIHECNHDDIPLIHRLWRSILFSIIPRKSRKTNKEPKYIADLRGSCDQSPIREKRREPGSFLEDTGDYMPKLKDAIVHLGKRLNASESIVVFPLSELIEDLERLMMHLEFDLDCPVDKRWIVECFEGIEIPYRVLIENYVSLIQRPDCPAIGNMAYSVAELVFDWIHASKRIDPASQQICHSLQNAIRSGEMMKWLQDGGVQDQLMRSRSFNHQNFERELTQPSKKIEEAIKQIEAFSKKK